MQPGDQTDIPRAGLTNKNWREFSTKWIEDGSYLCLKTLTIGYNFSPDFTRRIGMSSLRLYMQGQNLLTFTNYTGLESIFGLVFTDQDGSSLFVFTFQRYEYNVNPSLIDSFEAGDDRARLFAFIRNSNRPLKWSDLDNANNVKVIRFAEMYLIRSEAAAMRDNNLNAGVPDLNVIRNRAGLDDIDSFASMDQYVDAILQERRAELNYEGHRFFDVSRLNKHGELIIREDFKRAFPIPRDELQIQSNLIQNPGYPSE